MWPPPTVDQSLELLLVAVQDKQVNTSEGLIATTHLQVHSQPLVALGNKGQTTSSYKLSVAVKQHMHRKRCEGIPFLPLPL